MSEPAPAEPFALVLEGVTKDYPGRGKSEPVRALRGVDLKVRRGSRVAIQGPSGSGKSTLLQMMGALDVPTSGRVAVNGRDLSHLKDVELTDYRAHTVGFVFQQFNLIPNLSARENVELALEAVDAPPKVRRARAEELLDQVGMSPRVDHRPPKLSGGEQQRVAIARALANHPAILLADEPTGNLDSETGRSITELLRDLSQRFGVTVIVVTHSPEVAASCDEVHVIRDGRILPPGSEGTLPAMSPLVPVPAVSSSGMARACPRCNAVPPADSSFCHKCGTPLGARPDEASSLPPSP